MVPHTYPTIEGRLVLGVITDITGLNEWQDYIPVVAQTNPVASSRNTFANDGYMGVNVLSSLTGLNAWIDYIPCYVVTGRSSPFSVSPDGYISVSAEVGTLGGASLADYIINSKTPDLVADFNGSLNTGTEFYDAGGTVDTFAELITHSRAGNATMTDGYGPELASNVAADWVPFSGGSAVQDGEWIVITGASASSSGVILPLATEVGKQYAWTMEIELLTATVFLTQLQKPTNSQDAFSPTSFEYVTTNRTIIYQGIHTHTTAGSRLSAWPSGVGLTARIRNVSVREVPAIKWAPHNLVAYSEQFDNPGWQKTNTTVINNQTAAPDGSLTADKVIINSASFSYVRNLLAIDACQNTFGFFAKAGTTSNIQIYIIEQGVASGTADIDLSTGTVSNVAGVFTGGVTATDVGNGWYLIKGTRTFTASALNHRVGIAATGQNGLDFYICSCSQTR